MSDDDDPWFSGRSWADPDLIAHPDSPLGGGGPGGFSRPGPLGGGESGHSLGRPGWLNPGQGSGGLARRRGIRELLAYVAELSSAPSWEWLRDVAVKALGPYSFGLGVSVGLVKGPLEDVVGLIDLQKTFILADLYDRIRGAGSGLVPLGLPPPIAALYVAAVGLLAMGGLRVEELKEAHEEREKIKAELEAIIKNPGVFLSGMPARIRDEYVGKWSKAKALAAEADLGSQYEAGVIVGELLADVILTIGGVVSGVGAAASAAAKVPKLAKFARLAKHGKRADGGAVPKGKPTAERPAPPPRPKPQPFASAVHSGPHNQDWAKIDAQDFKTLRKVDMNNLSPQDAATRDALVRQGWKSDRIEQVLTSGDDFHFKQLQPGDKLYGFTSSAYSKHSAPSPFWTDEVGFRDVESKFFKNGVWDREGVKQYIALPCFNKVDAIDRAEVTAPTTGVESRIGPASENLQYVGSNGYTVDLKPHTMGGGGSQIAVDPKVLRPLPR